MDIERRVRDDGVVTLTLDDGGRNVFDAAGLEALGAAVDGCGDAAAIVLAGRPGALSAGLDTTVLAQLGRTGLHALLMVLGRTVLRIWTEARPVVCAATGHAVGAGAMLALASDHTVAADGAFKWGLIETRVGFAVPDFGIALARARLRSDRVEGLLLAGAPLDPAGAVEAGYADELAAPEAVVDRAEERATELATVPRPAYAGTKRRLRGAATAALLDGLAADLDALLRERP